MDSKIGALWFPKSSSDRGPIAKGSLDFSRLDNSEIEPIKQAMKEGGKIKVTLWKNRSDDDGKNYPNFTITLDKPWNKGTPEGDICF